MGYPATTKTLQTWLQEVDRIATSLRSASQQQKSFAAGGNLNMDMIRRYFDVLVQANNFLILAAAVPGIGAYLKAEKQDAVANPIAEFTAMKSQVILTLNWLRNNIPTDVFGGTEYTLGFVFPSDNISPATALTFTPQQTVTYRTQLDLLLGTIS